MTQADIPSRILIPSAFAAKNTTVLPIGSMDSEGNVVNFADGFPSVYGCPASGGGKFVTRNEMNALGRVATLDIISARAEASFSSILILLAQRADTQRAQSLIL